MKRLLAAVRHPLGQALGLVVAAYLIFKYGIEYLPPLFGKASAPVPQSIMIQFMLTALVGILIYVSDNEDRWRRFKQPIRATMVDADKRHLRTAFLIVIPLLVGFAALNQARPKVGALAQLRSIHPAPPGHITFQGRTIQLAGLENPLHKTGSIEDHLRTGRRVYYQSCLPCHGDLLDGLGHYAHGFNPQPLAFDGGTIAQLQESFVFWRVAKGGQDLPRESTPWNSAMPAWEDFLTEDEIWAVIIFLYDQSGTEPRAWEEHGAEGAEGAEGAGGD